MKTFQKFLTICCMGLFVASIAACGGGPADVETTDEAERNLPPAATGDMAPDDPDSGQATSFE